MAGQTHACTTTAVICLIFVLLLVVPVVGLAAGLAACMARSKPLPENVDEIFGRLEEPLHPLKSHCGAKAVRLGLALLLEGAERIEALVQLQVETG